MTVPTAKVAKAESNGVGEFDDARAALFSRRMVRLEQISITLRNLIRDYTQCTTAERQQKADIYLNSPASSHGERQGIASAQTASITSEALLLKGEIDALTEERDFIKFCIEHDGGG